MLLMYTEYAWHVLSGFHMSPCSFYFCWLFNNIKTITSSQAVQTQGTGWIQPAERTLLTPSLHYPPRLRSEAQAAYRPAPPTHTWVGEQLFWVTETIAIPTPSQLLLRTWTSTVKMAAETGGRGSAPVWACPEHSAWESTVWVGTSESKGHWDPHVTHPFHTSLSSQTAVISPSTVEYSHRHRHGCGLQSKPCHRYWTGKACG